CAALSSVKDLGQEEDRSQRRAHVVRYFDREVEAAAVGKLGGERLLQRRSARALRCFESLQRRDHLRSVRRALAPRLDDLLAQQLDKSATERERRTILLRLGRSLRAGLCNPHERSEEHTSELQSRENLV